MWRIELLGEPRVSGYGQTISHFESRRALALLAYLALFPSTRHPREVLVDRIWPEATVEAGRNRLKQALASLRRQLEPPWMEPGSVFDADRNHIGLRQGSFCCDVDELRQSIQHGDGEAVHLLARGELLPGFYDEWLEERRLEIDALRLEVELAPPSVGAIAPKRNPSRIVPPITSFRGREIEVRLSLQALEASRWITITGFGGIGKTRLTQEIALQFEGPNLFVPLAQASSRADILESLLRVLNAESAGADPIATIAQALEPGTLLIFDNLEQIADIVGPVIRDLLKAAPTITVLGSSRIPIREEGESEIPLGPLTLPDDVDPARLTENPCVQLFVDRARKVRADFQVSARNADSIAQICHRLDGLPLAIELCAAWAHAVSPAQMLDNLGSESDLLVSRRRDSNDRHRSLTQVFETSARLLSDESRSLLAKLSVFHGGWDWDAAEAVCETPNLLNGLTELIELAFVRPSHDTDPPRYTLLESLRQYAEGLLSGEQRIQLRRIHQDLFASLAQASSKVASDSARAIRDQSDWISYLNTDWANFRAAVRTAVEDGRLHQAIHTLADTEWYWSVYRAEAPPIDLLPDSGGLPEDRLLADLLIGTYRLTKADAEEIERFFTALYARAIELENRQLLGECRIRLARLLLLRQQMAKVELLAQDAFNYFENSGDVGGQGVALHILANCAIQKRDRAAVAALRKEAALRFSQSGAQIHAAALVYTEARECYVEKRYADALPFLYRCRDLGRGLQNFRFMGRTANLFGCIHRNLGNERLARVYFYLAVAANARAAEIRGMHIPLWNLFLSLGVDNLYESAVAVSGAAMALWDDYFRVPLDPEDRALFDDFRASATSALGAAKFSDLEQTGRLWTLNEMTPKVRDFVVNELDEYTDEAKTFFGNSFHELQL